MDRTEVARRPEVWPVDNVFLERVISSKSHSNWIKLIIRASSNQRYFTSILSAAS
jgi:hypothetical protein